MAVQLDRATLEAALVGYQKQVEEIQTKMTELRRRLGHAPAASSGSPTRGRKHRMSAEGRARIAAAQRARWAKFKKKKAE
jgi:hypothetical protein